MDPCHYLLAQPLSPNSSDHPTAEVPSTFDFVSCNSLLDGSNTQNMHWNSLNDYVYIGTNLL